MKEVKERGGGTMALEEIRVKEKRREVRGKKGGGKTSEKSWRKRENQGERKK